MATADILFYFDFVDPLSWVVEQALGRFHPSGGQVSVRPVALELRPPPTPLLDPDGAWWKRRRQEAAALADELDLSPGAEPRLIPWSRKAHELAAYAHASGVGDEVRLAIFEAFFRRGEDVGRVDVLVRLAEGLGLEHTAVKAALDVDRYAEQIVREGALAREAGVGEPPVLAGDDAALQPFRKHDGLRTFLRP
ncbi:MAG: DsbA family protein [Gemmatimonadota bacterium]|jgi:predicted DsbA family dithiol-disulfide isomerase